MKRSVNLARKPKRATASDIVHTMRKLGMSDEQIRIAVLKDHCPDCKVLVFEGEETMLYCSKHTPKEMA